MADQKKILVIEDEKVLGEILVEKLREEGYAAELSEDGRAGFDRLTSWKPHLLLLDILLPNMNGYEILEGMKKDATLSKIPVVVISNSGQPVEIDRVLSLGAKDYLIKADFSPEQVLEKVHKYLPEAPTPASSSAPAPAARTGSSILIVEDDPFLQELLNKKFTEEGFAVSLAQDGDGAVKKADEVRPDVILLDVVMPQSDGFEALETLRKDRSFDATPIVIFSNLSQEKDFERAKQLGATEFIIKSNVTLSEAVVRIKQILTQKLPALDGIPTDSQ